MDFLSKIFGVNYKTTMGGIGMILGGASGLIHCFTATHPDASSGAPPPPDMTSCVITSVTMMGAGWAMLRAKDAGVVGAGETAQRVAK